MLRRLIQLILWCAIGAFCAPDVSAQGVHYFWLTFRDKDTISYQTDQPQHYLSERALKRRTLLNVPVTFTDLPVHQAYPQRLESMGLRVVQCSRWMNAAWVIWSDNKLPDSIAHLPFVREVRYLGERKKFRQSGTKDIQELLSALDEKVNPGSKNKPDSGWYGKTAGQIAMLATDRLHRMGYHGKGIRIAVLDAGFDQLHRNTFFKHLFDSSRIILTRDLIDSHTGVLEDDQHGVQVLSCMAAYKPFFAMGTAFNAEYLLIRTEDAANENLYEEAAWICGAELADSAGADIIQSSLGYSEFDDMQFNHKIKELNGKSTLISQGASLATSKGLIVVCSAGNEGVNSWRKIVAPADVKEVITVGGVDHEGNLALFSSIGPTADKRIKPDVMAMGENAIVVSADAVLFPAKGTSFACPLISGTIACLKEACPEALPLQIASALRMSSDQYFDPDRYRGFGIPDAQLALRMLRSQDSTSALLDVRRLMDHKLHLTYVATQDAKVALHVFDTNQKEIYKDKWNVKEAGYYRIGIRKSKKWKMQNLTFVLTVNDSEYTFTYQP